MPRTMLIVALAAIFVGFSLATSSTAAPPVTAVSGTLTGTPTFESGANAVLFCGSSPVTLNDVGTFAATFIGSGSYSATITRIDPCTLGAVGTPFDSEGLPYAVTSTVTFTGHGGTLTATGAGTGHSESVGTGHSYNDTFSISLEILSGTGRYARVRGTLTIAYNYFANIAHDAAQGTGVFSGSISR